MPKRPSILPTILLASALAAPAAPPPLALVICAPGYPGTTKEAQPNMDMLAGALAKTSGLPPARVTAEYYEAEAAGTSRLKAPGAAVAMVPLPYFLAHESELKLKARAQAVEKDQNATVTWTFVAKKGRATGPAALAGFEIVSLAAYAPDFIRNVALAKWGKLPADVKFTASGQVLSALRRAANGENVAVLLDASQTASLSTLPFAAELDPVATSAPIPGILVCTVGAAASASEADKLIAGMQKLGQTPEGTAALDAVRLSKVVPLDAKALAAARASYRPAAATASK